MSQIQLSRLKSIIKEELAALKPDAPKSKDPGLSPQASQSEKIKASADVLNNVVVLLKAIETFEEKANSTLKTKLLGKLEDLKSDLNHISKFADDYIEGGKTSPSVSPNTLLKPKSKSIKPAVVPTKK